MSSEHVAKIIDFLRNGRKAEDVSLEDVMRLAELMAESFQSFFKSMDLAIYAELGEMAREIANMKEELALLRLSDMRDEHIPTAGRELDAIVEATEEATNTIMSAAEEIMAADAADSDAYQALVGEKVIDIFQACSFQDITGQRISKVVSTLNALDKRITTLVEKLKILRITDAAGNETAAEKRARELMLNGPQFKGEGVSQDDIDAFF
jgi:chemotaxis protein CheZ